MLLLGAVGVAVVKAIGIIVASWNSRVAAGVTRLIVGSATEVLVATRAAGTMMIMIMIMSLIILIHCVVVVCAL